MIKRIILLAFCLLFLAGTASAYQLYVTCPADKSSTNPVNEIQAGLPLKCSVESNLPAGTTFYLTLYQAQYTATLIDKRPVTIQDNQETQYVLFDTQGLPGGQYKVETEFIGTGESKLSSDSVSMQLVTLIDRSDEIEITSPLSQELADALRIEGAIKDLGADGVKIEVHGPDGVIFREQYIPTTRNIKDSSGAFSKKIAVMSAGEYEVTFADAKGYIGEVKFFVVAPVTATPTTIPTTTAAVIETTVPTTVPTPWPTATQSPLLPSTALLALCIGGLIAFLATRR